MLDDMSSYIETKDDGKFTVSPKSRDGKHYEVNGGAINIFSDKTKTNLEGIQVPGIPTIISRTECQAFINND